MILVFFSYVYVGFRILEGEVKDVKYVKREMSTESRCQLLAYA